MEGDLMDHQDVIAASRTVRVVQPRDRIAWELSLMRVARAQSVLWHETPINERQKLLARVDAEMKGEQ